MNTQGAKPRGRRALKLLAVLGVLSGVLLGGCSPGKLLNRTRHMFGGDLHVEVTVDQRLNQDRKSTRLNSSHSQQSRMPSSA